MAKHSSPKPINHPRLFAQKYKLSRQLPLQEDGELWLGEKDGQSFWIYYFALADENAVEAWRKWQLELERLKANSSTKSLILPVDVQQENQSAVVVFPAPVVSDILKEDTDLTELDLALLMLDMSQTLLSLEANRSQMHLKSSKIYRRPEGGFALFGWGIERLQNAISKKKDLEGKEAYLAPEYFIENQEVAAPAGIFSLGVCLFELASGKLPFGEKGGARLAKVKADLPTLPKYSERLNNILHLMMAQKADRRPSADTLFRLANTFIKEQEWKSVGGFSFAPQLSGIPLINNEVPVSAPKAQHTPKAEQTVKAEQTPKASKPKKQPQTPKVEKAQQAEVKRSPEVKTETTSNNKLKLGLGLLAICVVLGGVAWFVFGQAEETTSSASKVAVVELKHAEALSELMNSRSQFEELILGMESNSNLPPTEKTFLRLAQMQLKNLDMDLEKRLVINAGSVEAWKGTSDNNWLQHSQAQLSRNIQNLELLR